MAANLQPGGALLDHHRQNTLKVPGKTIYLSLDDFKAIIQGGSILKDR